MENMNSVIEAEAETLNHAIVTEANILAAAASNPSRQLTPVHSNSAQGLAAQAARIAGGEQPVAEAKLITGILAGDYCESIPRSFYTTWRLALFSIWPYLALAY